MPSLVLYLLRLQLGFALLQKNSATASCEKIVRVKASAKVKRWELLKDNDENDQNLPLSVSAGSCFPPLAFCRYDEYDNIIPFESIQHIEYQLMSNGTPISHIKNVKVELSPYMDHMIVTNARITADNLDKIRPSYEVTLALSQPDMQPFLNIPCQVFPGPLRAVHFSLSGSGKGLLPQQVVEDFKLEMFDRHKNHVKQGVEVELVVHGFSFLDKIGLMRKVDNDGFIDLSGLLKVTEGFGKPVSLSVKYNKNVIFTKKFIVEKRELRMVTLVPEVCPAGSKLKDIAFEVVNAEGVVDLTISDEAKHGKSHTLRIVTNLPNDDSLRYAFRQGQCIVPSISLPQSEGSFCIEAVHSHHQELRVKFEITISRSTRTEHDTTSDLRATEELDCDISQSSDERFTPLSVSDAAIPAKDVRTKKGFEFHNAEVTVPLSLEECDTLSSLQTPKVEHGKSTPALFSESKLQKQPVTVPLSLEECDTLSSLQTPKVEHGKSTPGLFSESKLQKQQAPLAQTSNKQSDSNYEHSNDIFKSPEGKIICADPCTPKHAITLLGSDLQDFESIEKEIHHYGSCIRDQEEYLKWSVVHRGGIIEDLRHLQAELEVLPLPLSQLDSMSQKELLSGKIENKVDSAAALYITASQNMSLKNRYPEFMTDVVGLVALLATAPTPMLSRSLAEYLGEDQMLGIVCLSSAAITTPENYETVLKSLAGQLGRSFKGRQLIICLEDIRAYAGNVLEINHQRRLDFPNPTLPDGTTPPGFLGYAVNMIDINADHIQVTTVAGYGLRETLFYHLFGDLQVYKTKEQMKYALECITNAAISLDGGIMRRKGTVLLGSMLVDVHFPVVAEEQESLSREQIMKEIEKKKSDLSIVEQAIAHTNKLRESYLNDFHEIKAGYLKLIEDKEATQKLILSQQSLQTTPKAPAPTQSPGQ